MMIVELLIYAHEAIEMHNDLTIHLQDLFCCIIKNILCTKCIYNYSYLKNYYTTP
jgi:hypothetical protein